MEPKRHLPAVMALLGSLSIGGCASQETILPPTEHSMLEIYRGTLNTDSTADIALLQPTAVCQDLELEESLETCEEKITAHHATAYQQLDAQPAGEALDYLPYTREVATETRNLFPRLANPDLLIYVYPHLATRSRAPIPGYTTVIPLYERVQYRLPGESQRVTPVAVTQAIPSTQPAAGTDTSAERYHKSSDLEGQPLAPQTLEATATKDESTESPGIDDKDAP
jgi:conjugative transfer region lipoprotein (TIGR03751 family)